MLSIMPKVIQEILKKGDFDKQRLNTDTRNFQEHGLSPNVFYVSGCIDACKDILAILFNNVTVTDKDQQEISDSWLYLIDKIRNALLVKTDYKEVAFLIQMLVKFKNYCLHKYATKEVYIKIEQFIRDTVSR